MADLSELRAVSEPEFASHRRGMAGFGFCAPLCPPAGPQHLGTEIPRPRWSEELFVNLSPSGHEGCSALDPISLVTLGDECDSWESSVLFVLRLCFLASLAMQLKR